MGDVKTVTTYEFPAFGLCPVDQSVDEYAVTIVAEEGLMLGVEVILENVEQLLKLPIYQERFTRSLRARLAHEEDPVRVTTVGEHSGVKTTCVSS